MANYTSNYSGEEIDEGITKALAGGSGILTVPVTVDGDNMSIAWEDYEKIQPEIDKGSPVCLRIDREDSQTYAISAFCAYESASETFFIGYDGYDSSEGHIELYQLNVNPGSHICQVDVRQVFPPIPDSSSANNGDCVMYSSDDGLFWGNPLPDTDSADYKDCLMYNPEGGLFWGKLLPQYTGEDEGAVLKIVDGTPQWVLETISE